jgi:peptidoglycan/LPS O-acetylase OafA/YrhL
MQAQPGAVRRAGPGFAYRPALDGLRALAVTGVLLFHGGVAWLPGGFLGVDAFFVLSGYLITSLLLVERARTGRIRLGAFWLRRARRLLPALLVLLVTVVLVFRGLLAPFEVTLLRGDALSALGYVANWRMIYRGDDYFAQTSAPSPLQHTWSLGIEEQFYLIWPLIVVGLFALTRRYVSRVLTVLCIVGAVASAVAGAVLFRADEVNRTYFGTDTRAQALLVGCALATILDRRRRPAAGAAAPARARTAWAAHVRAVPWSGPGAGEWALTFAGMSGVVVLGWLWTHAHGTDAVLFRGGLALDALAVAAMIAYAVRIPRDPLARVLSLAPVVWLGRISYGVYLWHWPLYAWLTAERSALTGVSLLATRVGATVLVATVSFVMVEEPIRRGRWPWPVRVVPRRHLRPAAFAVSAVGLVGLTGFVVVAETTPPPAGPPASAVYALPQQTSPATPRAPIERPGRRPGTEPRIDFFGDSVSWTLGTYLPPHPGLVITTRSLQGCGIARLPDLLQLGTGGTNYPGCDTWDTRWRRGVRVDDPDVSVILLDRWELMDRFITGAYHHVGEPIYDAYLSGELHLAISIAGSRGAKVVLLTAPYTHRAERPDGGLYDEDQPTRVDAWNRLLLQAAASDPSHVVVIDLNRRVCPDGTFTWNIGDLQIRSDGLHFTPAGVQQWIAPWLLPQLAEIAYGLPPVPPPGPSAWPTRASR